MTSSNAASALSSLRKSKWDDDDDDPKISLSSKPSKRFRKSALSGVNVSRPGSPLKSINKTSNSDGTHRLNSMIGVRGHQFLLPGHLNRSSLG
ncbi:hypothetical protein BY996DRAFT_482784 [Phakopsora pachyrhizi]|nr:hypothetical protein BY996DRAFT_482784 [Phakopsora pachyrhizi]